MSKKLIVLVALMSLALVGSSFAAVENIKVSGDIQSSAITRNLSLGSTTRPTLDAEDFLFSQIRLRFDADLTEGVSAVVEFLNERNWGDTDIGSDNDDEIRLEKAYLQLNEFLYQPLTVKIGRQNLYFGNGLIVGDPDTNQADNFYWSGTTTGWTDAGDLSLHKSFDALRTTLDYAPYTIDMIYAKIDENSTNMRDDISVAGVNVAYDWASYNGITEGYFFYQQGTDTSQVSEEDEDNIWVIGGRMQYDPNDNWTLGAEGAFQGGKDYSASDNREAWAGIANVEYRFLNDYNAKLGLKYAYLSGDDDSGDGKNGAWDPMFEDQTPAEIINILFANTNMMYTQLKGSMMPREDITLGLQWTWAKFAENNGTNSTYGPSVGSAINNIYTVDRDETEIGNEIDAYACYDYTEDVQIKLTGAWFMPGDYFTSANDDTAYSLRAGINVDF